MNNDKDGLEQIPDGNRFKPVIESLRRSGWDWERVWEEIEEAYNPVDRAAFEASYESMNDYNG